MEGESGVDSPSITFSEWADELCGYYMAIGVTEQDYWYGDPTHLKYYVSAHEKKNEQKNQELWLQGLYIYKALNVVINNALAKKGSKPETYLEQPIRITPLTEAEKQANAETERQKIIADLTGWGEAWERRDK